MLLAVRIMDEVSTNLTHTDKCSKSLQLPMFIFSGFLQTSYERNYGDLGAFIFKSHEVGIDADRGRKLLVNYPQSIDPFGVIGWTGTRVKL